eukprot:TRINITY_DN6553_c0_g1_i1.p1 TRINITY_DN6553_c0_g1~~TRINITY_DN6553_c0_g1_i1.p1  ORF type:complete len:219 (-),score=43.57 TRINITY_DN6553_c0_g1_i1:255-911(-)
MADSLARILLILSSLIICSSPLVQGLLFTVDKKECFKLDVRRPFETIAGIYVLYQYEGYWHGSSHSDLSLRVYDPSGTEVYRKLNTAEDRFHLAANMVGIFNVCIESEAPWPEQVDIELGIGQDAFLVGFSKEDLAQDEHMQEVTNQIQSIATKLWELQIDQHYFRSREARRRKTNESTRRRVLMYAIVEALVLVAASAAQVIILRALFEKKARSRAL